MTNELELQELTKNFLEQKLRKYGVEFNDTRYTTLEVKPYIETYYEIQDIDTVEEARLATSEMFDSFISSLSATIKTILIEDIATYIVTATNTNEFKRGMRIIVRFSYIS